MAKVKVIEALCGCGKSHWMLKHMNDRPDERWLFVTPLLSEAGDPDSNLVGRASKDAPNLHFKSPSATTDNKMKDLVRLLERGENISITHKLFSDIGEDVVDLIFKQGYCLVVDETIDKVEVHSNSSQELLEDIKDLIKLEFITMNETGKLNWTGVRMSRYEEEWELCDRGMLYLFNNRLLIKRHSSRAYETAKEVWILTYMFNASIMRVWMEICKLEYEYYLPDLRITTKERKEQIRSLVTVEKDEDILDDWNEERFNEYGSRWWKRMGNNPHLKRDIQDVSDRLYRRWRKRLNQPPDIMYTVFKDHIEMVACTGVKRSLYTNPESNFVSKQARATNLYSKKNCLIYWCNIYPHYSVKQYLDGGVMRDEDKLDSDQYALSELIQWVFRSRLREGQPISIFIASRRMKRLFDEWLAHND